MGVRDERWQAASTLGVQGIELRSRLVGAGVWRRRRAPRSGAERTESTCGGEEPLHRAGDGVPAAHFVRGPYFRARLSLRSLCHLSWSYETRVVSV